MTRRLLLGALSSIGATAEEDLQQTVGAYNGRWWKGLGGQRVVAVAGTHAGVQLCLELMRQDKSIPRDSITRIAGPLIPKHHTYGDMEEEITKLYDSDPANVIIPYTDMYSIAASALSGTNPTETNESIVTLRTIYVKIK